MAEATVSPVKPAARSTPTSSATTNGMRVGMT